MKPLIKNLRMIALAIMAISFLGCEDDEEELPEVKAGFTQTFEKTTGSITFLNISENAEKYEWDFGDGETSTEISPIKVYENGTYSVVMKAINKADDSDTFEDEIIIDIDIPFSLPLSFDVDDVDLAISAFGGAKFTLVDNPVLSGTNDEDSKVGVIINSGAKEEGITLTLEGAIDLSVESKIALNFWSDVAVDVTMKLEESTAPVEGRTSQVTNSIETQASHRGTGWEIIVFDFDSSDEFSVMTLFVDKDGISAGIFYFDDTQQGADFDTSPPVITLIGNATISISQGSAFTDEGATANDDVDGDISANIEVGGDVVDVNTPGTYVITYNVSDAFGNSAVEVTRTVNVVEASVDITPPIITLSGDATIELTVGDPYTDQGATANDAVDGDISASIVTTGVDVVDTSVEGTYTITYNVSDAAGNAATEVTRMVVVSATIDEGGGTELLTNGDFETGVATPWTGAGGDPEIQTDGGNSFYFTNPQTPGANQFDINLQQVAELTENDNYVLTFEASTGTGNTRTIVAGIGKQGDDFMGDDKQTITLTDQTQMFTLNLTATGFGVPASAMSRVYFDLAGEAGVVVIDNVSLVAGGAGSGGGGGDTGGGLTTNGNFETGDKTGWTEFPNGGATFAVTNEEAESGTFSGKLVAGEGADIVIKQANLASGTIGTNVSVIVTFDMKGTLTGAGGVVFAEFFSEISPEGVSKSEIFTNAPLTVNSDWTPYSFTTTTDATDVSGGVTLQLKAACGVVTGCVVEAFFENISITIDE